MLKKAIPILLISAFLYGAATGNFQGLSEAVSASMDKCVKLFLWLLGNMCFWNGLTEVWKQSGCVSVFSRILKPILRRLFPDTEKDKESMDSISLAVTANILGIGNAATPLGISAMGKFLEKNSDKKTADRNMILFTALAVFPPILLPSTVIAMRASAGSVSPASVLPAVWICSLCSTVTAVILCRIFGGSHERNI